MNSLSFFSNLKSQQFFFLACVFALAFSACQTQDSDTATSTPTTTEKTPPAPISLVVEAESFGASEGNMQIEKNTEGNSVLSPAGDSWMAFEVNIPKAGRYAFDLRATGAATATTAWMEDYIDNKDERTYDITGPIALTGAGDTFHAFVKDGSPLNAGVHQMKLHLQGASVKVDRITFTLLKEHQNTPKTLTQKTDGSEWVVAWSDEFDGTGLPDTSKWTYDIGNWGWGNKELQYYTENRLENARQENGNLIIEARKNDMGQAWTSARLTTRGKVTFRYGRIEFKAKVPPNKGNWAAGWTLGDDYVDELSWPYCGEIDILESVGYEMDNETGNGKAHASIHCGAYYFKLGNQPTSDIPVKNMHEEFHIYSVDWTPDGITAAVDGKEYFSYTDNTSELAWPYDKAQNIILNLAMGGGWGGLQGMDDTMESQQFIIDYVRVYEKR